MNEEKQIRKLLKEQHTIQPIVDLVRIDTCHNVSQFGKNVEGTEPDRKDDFGFVCSRCGIKVLPTEFWDSPLLETKKMFHERLYYCPYCGARIEEE